MSYVPHRRRLSTITGRSAFGKRKRAETHPLDPKRLYSRIPNTIKVMKTYT